MPARAAWRTSGWCRRPWRSWAPSSRRRTSTHRCRTNSLRTPLAWQKALGADLAKLNCNGGACALGHPLGGTGAKLMTTLCSELARRPNVRYGLQAICEGGGTANATIIERMDGNSKL